MKCRSCKRNIAAGAEATKLIVEYRQPDGTTKVFGYQMPDGPLAKATGQIVAGWHGKCFWVVRKREQRGDAVTGRVLNGIPTGYDIGNLVLSREEFDALGLTVQQARAQGTAYLSARLEQLRAVARRIGKSVGDATVAEALRADEHGGPYPHSHHLRLDTYQLRAHLTYAHGQPATGGAAAGTPLQDVHDLLHARAGLDQVRAARGDDPGHTEPAERDWRDQATADL